MKWIPSLPLSALLLLLFFGWSQRSYAQNERFRLGGGQSEENREERERSASPNQNEEKALPAWREKLVFGGGASLGFGNNSNIMLAPQLGYRLSNRWIAGVGYLFNYVRITQTWDNNSGNIVRLPEPLEYTIQGPNAFVNFFPFESIFLGSQFEYLKHKLPSANPITGNWSAEALSTPVLWVQGGYRQSLGGRSFAQIGLRLNLLHDDRSPYSQSWMPIFLFFF